LSHSAILAARVAGRLQGFVTALPRGKITLCLAIANAELLACDGDPISGHWGISVGVATGFVHE